MADPNQPERPGAKPPATGGGVRPIWLYAGLAAIIVIAGALWYYGSMSDQDASAVATPATDAEEMPAEEMPAEEMPAEEMPADEGAPAEPADEGAADGGG